jgi:hypothetical protein
MGMDDEGSGDATLTVLLHDREDLDDDLGRGSDKDLSLSSSLSVDDVVLGCQRRDLARPKGTKGTTTYEAVVKNGNSDHFD